MRNRRLAEVRIYLVLIVFAVLASWPALSIAQTVTLVQSNARFAGSGFPGGFNKDFAPATTVDLTPAWLAIDSAGNLFISDTQSNCVRKVDTSGTISTVVGLAIPGKGDTCNTSSNPTPLSTQGLYQPTGLALDSANNLYISDSKHNCVRRLPSGSVTGVSSLTTVAGTCDSASSATLSPSALALDSSGDLYIALADTASSTYQVLLQKPAAALCLMAGAPSAAVSNICSGVTGGITLNAPSGLALDITGNLFIADTGNNCVRELVNLNTPQTAVGQCTNDSTGSSATALNSPRGLILTPSQILYITESAPTNNVVSYVLGSNSLTNVAGLPSGAAGPYSPTQDGTSALNSPLNTPVGIAVDPSGNLFVSDSGNFIVRRLPNSLLFQTTPVGSPSASLPVTLTVNQSVNLTASASADFKITSNTCTGALSSAPSGNPPTTCQVFLSFAPTKPGIRGAPLSLTDSISKTTVFVGLEANANGPLSAFTPGTVNTAAASLSSPVAVATDATGNAYILEAGSNPSLVVLPAGTSTPTTVIAPGKGLQTPSALAIDAAGNFYIADSAHGTVSRFGADGTVNTSYVTGLDTPTALAIDDFNNLYIAQAGAAHNVIEVFLGGSRLTIAGSGSFLSANGVLASTAQFVSPSGLYLDLNGILYIADSGGHLVYAIDKTSLIHQVAGNGTTTTSTPGQATGTALLKPVSLAVDAAGDINIADSAANIVYTVFTSTNAAGANIAPTLGTGTAGNTGDGGPSTLAQINNPLSVAVDSNASLFTIDSGNSSLRKVTYSNPTLNFGSVLIGQTSPVIIQNLSNFGTENLTLTQPFSTSDPHFTVDSSTTTCGASIITGSTCNIGYTFTPTSTGPVTATSVLATNSPNSPQPITLIATGQVISPIQFSAPPETEVYGQPFPATMTYTGGTAAPTGTITFTFGGQTLCTLTGTFTPTTTCNAPNSGLAVGPYTITFIYSGDGNYAPVTLNTTLTVTPAPLTVTVDNATRPINTANPTFTGTITGAVPGDTFTATYSTSAVTSSPAGTYPIVATVTAQGSTSLANYALNIVPGTLTITSPSGNLIATTTTLATSGSPAAAGANVTFTATVTSANGTPAGTVTFSDGTVQIGQATLSPGGIATFSTASLPPGTHTIVASFQGNTTFAASFASLTQIITPSATTPAATATALASSASPAAPGANVIFTATVTSPSGIPSGIVIFTDGATPLGQATLNANGIATFSSTTLAEGNHSITASFEASQSFAASAATITQVISNSGVAPATTSTSVTTSGSPAAPGANVTFTATVTSPNGTPSGTVIFSDGTTPLGQAALNSSGIASFSTASLAVGTHTITAAFQANTTFAASSGSLTQIISNSGVTPAATNTTITTSGSPAIAGASVTFTATVSSSSGVPNGTVLFSDGATVLGQATLNSTGVASFSTSSLAAGTHTITAAFEANTSFAASSGSVTQVITPAATGSFTISASPSAQYIRGAGSTAFQVTLTSTGGFTGQIALACSGLPSDAACTFSSNPTLTAGSSATVTMTVTNTAADAKLRAPSIASPTNPAPVTIAAVLPFEFTGIGVFFAGLTRRRSRSKKNAGLLVLLLVSLGILGLSGCCFNSATFKTYTISITGSSASSAVPSQSTSVVLSVGN